MKRFAPIGNETEFQQWLASVLEAERERLRKKAAARESQTHMSFEVAEEKYHEGDTAQ